MLAYSKAAGLRIVAVIAQYRYNGLAVFSMICALDGRTKEIAHLLQTITDTKYWDFIDFRVKDVGVNSRCIIVVDRVRRSRQYDTCVKVNQRVLTALHRLFASTRRLERNISQFCCAWQHFAIHAQLSQAPDDKMGVLGSKVEHQAAYA